MTSSQEVFGNGSLTSSLPEIDCPGRHYIQVVIIVFNSAESWSGFRKFPGWFDHLNNYRIWNWGNPQIGEPQLNKSTKNGRYYQQCDVTPVLLFVEIKPCRSSNDSMWRLLQRPWSSSTCKLKQLPTLRKIIPRSFDDKLVHPINWNKKCFLFEISMATILLLMEEFLHHLGW